MNANTACALVLVLAFAKPAAGEEVTAAQAAFAAGEKAFARNDYVVALEEFRRAFREEPRDAVRFNIGVCLERLGRYEEAAKEFEVAANSVELPPEKRERAREQGELARSRLGTLLATSDPEGATLYVDGARVCRMPCSVKLDPRSHSLLAKLANREATQAVTIVAGEERSIRLRLPEPAGRVPPAPRRERIGEVETRFLPGALGWVGAGTFLVGSAGFVGFGLRARDLERTYAEAPTRDTRDEGLRMQTLTNISLGVAITGAALVAVDLFVLGHSRRTAGRSNDQPSLVQF